MKILQRKDYALQNILIWEAEEADRITARDVFKHIEVDFKIQAIKFLTIKNEEIVYLESESGAFGMEGGGVHYQLFPLGMILVVNERQLE